MPLLARGFQFDEVMTGSYSFTDRPGTSRFRFSAHMEAPSLLAHMRDGRMELTGTLEMDGFADRVPIRGRITMLPWTRKLIRYEFEFEGNDGKPYRFIGQKDIKLRRLRKSFTTLPGRVLDAGGREVAKVRSYFDADSDLRQFIASWRPA